MPRMTGSGKPNCSGFNLCEGPVRAVLLNATLYANIRSSEGDQERDRTNGGFAMGVRCPLRKALRIARLGSRFL